MNPNNTGQNALPIPVALGCPPPPSIGRKAIHVTIDFSLGATFALDLSQVQAQGDFDSVQTVYVDNRNNTGTLVGTMGVTNQNITVPAGAQGYFNVLQNNPPQLTFKAATGTPIVDIFLLNFFVPPSLWYATGGIPITDTTLAAVITNGAVNTNSQAATLTGAIDASGVIAAAGVRQQLFAADSSRKRWILTNPLAATEKLQFSYVNNTNGLIDLAPGSTWDESDQSVSGDAIFVVAATINHAFVAYRWG